MYFRSADVAVHTTPRPRLAVDRASHTRDASSPPAPADVVPSTGSAISGESADEKIPDWAIALIVVVCVLCLLFFACALAMYLREKQGKPIFVSLEPGTTNAQVDKV